TYAATLHGRPGSPNASPLIPSGIVGRRTFSKPAPTCAPSRCCSDTEIWRPQRATFISRRNTCTPRRIRWRSSNSPLCKQAVRALKVKSRDEPACRGGGRHPPPQGSRFLDRYESSFHYQQLKAFRAIQRCRTAALGGHLDSCPQCGHQAISYNSCRNRHCPKCQTEARERWVAKREQELLSTSYFHLVFTLPHELNGLALNNPREFYELLFRASAAA